MADDILKFGCENDDPGNGEFVWLGDAVAWWAANCLDAQNRQQRHVKFLQDGPVTAPNTTITLPANIDSMGYDFVVTNPKNYNWIRTVDNNPNVYFMDFNKYKAANVTFNRIHFARKGNYATTIIYGLGGANPTYHAADNEYAITFYNCVALSLNGITVLYASSATNKLRIRMFNNIFIAMGNAVHLISANLAQIWLPAEIENNIFLVYGQSDFGNVQSTIRNNLFLCPARSVGYSQALIMPGWSSLSAHVTAELLLNAYNFENGSYATGIDPTRKALDPRLLFPQFVNTALADTAVWLNGTIVPNTAWLDMHTVVEMLTPRNAGMAVITEPPEPRVNNPLRYFINGGDKQQWGEQYGAAAYGWQEHTAVLDLTATDQGDGTILLEWTIPPGFPSGFAHWGIYKHYWPKTTLLPDFISRKVKIGTAPIAGTSFLDDGVVSVNSAVEDMTYRIVPERT